MVLILHLLLLLLLFQIRDKFYDIQNQLQKASKWRESICGEPYDLTFLNDMTVKLDVRQELWKYVESSTHAIKEWKSMLFKKVYHLSRLTFISKFIHMYFFFYFFSKFPERSIKYAKKHSHVVSTEVK